jgi:hypothetical protein
MKSTPIYALPYPEAPDHTRTWEYWQGLAERMETVLAARSPSYVARQVLGANTQTVTFSAIPAGLRRIDVYISARSTENTGGTPMFVRINGDVTNTNYGTAQMFSAGAAFTASYFAGVAGGSPIGRNIGAAISNQGRWGLTTGSFLGWDRGRPSLQWQTVTSLHSGDLANAVLGIYSGTYLAAGPYTSITFIDSAAQFLANSEFQLEGWAS